jgi:hypothetical protein
MPEESKFAGTLKRLRRMPEEREGENPILITPDQPRQISQRSSGKRSDPAWSPITILMRKSVKRNVRRRLEDEEQGRDLSTLIDELLTAWLTRENNPPDMM